MLSPTTFYDHPDLYDLEYSGLSEDLGYYLRLARGASTLLELGCGTGRLTLPLARSQVAVTGLDASAAMLGRLRARLGAEPRLKVELLQGDFRALDLGRRFDRVILPFNAVHHAQTATDLRALLDGVARHLAPEGIFGLDMLVPDHHFWDRDPDGVHEVRWYPDPAGGRMKTWENGFYDPITQVNHVRYHYQRAAGQHEVVHVNMRMYYPQEILDHLQQGGWTLRRLDGDFEGHALSSGSAKMVMQLTRG